MTHEKVSLFDISLAVARFIKGRRDVVVFGAHAVNNYIADPRATSDIDVLSTNAEALAEGIRTHLAKEFHIAVRVRPMTKRGAGFRVYQVTKPNPRKLVDVRQEPHLPMSMSRTRDDVRFVEPVTLIAMKVVSYAARRNQIKGDTDRADVRRLLQTFPQHRKARGEIYAKLTSSGASGAVLKIWDDFVSERLDPDSDDY